MRNTTPVRPDAFPEACSKRATRHKLMQWAKCTCCSSLVGADSAACPATT